MSDNIVYREIPEDEFGNRYELIETFVYTSELFKRSITIEKGRRSDGATVAIDLGIFEETLPRGLRILVWYYRGKKGNRTPAWWVHDEICIEPFWDDGTPITNFIASVILCTILHRDGYWLASFLWFLPTLFFGGKNVVKTNGRFFPKREAKGNG